MTDLSTYHAHIATKRVAFEPRGFSGSFDLPDAMFPHQRSVTDFALRAGCAALFLDTGLGKTLCALAWGDEIVRRTNRPVLMLAPLAVGHQHLAEAERFGIEAQISRFGLPPDKPKIGITNYERLEKFDPTEWGGVILDECFAPDTPVDVVEWSGVSRKHIEDVRVGDKIINAAGVDIVSDVHRREVPYAVRVRYAGREVVASPNHPFFTLRGWVGAQDLVPGDEILAASAAMRMVRESVHGRLRAGGEDKVLRSILLSEMADAPAGALSESSQSRSRSQTRARKKRVAQERQAGSKGGAGAHYSAQPHVHTQREGKGFPPVERDRARTFRAWGQRAWFDRAAVSFDGCAARDMEGGVCFVVGSADSWLSHALQNRLGERRKANSYRGGWSLTLFSCESRPQERGKARSFRVDGIEVLEPGHPGLDRYRDADGKLYFYDLGGTRHPSFSVHGGLVHNSSILKSFDGKTTRRLIEAFSTTPYRLACTATPAPNDHTELGTHAEFLGAMRRELMLARWFINDTSDTKTWRLKGHAARDFWRWVSSWSRCVSLPSDIGFSDNGFVLPELTIKRHNITADRSIEPGEEKSGQGRLFRLPDTSATSIHREKKLTREYRAAEVARIVSSEPDEAWLVWVDTDYDADAVKAALPRAVEVSGKMKLEIKEERLDSFSRGETKLLVTKPSVAGYGLNWQRCARVVFMGISFSYESFYQAVRRCWRFGQKRPVHVHVVCADTEASIWEVVNRKSGDHDTMKAAMREAMREACRLERPLDDYHPEKEACLPAWMTACR